MTKEQRERTPIEKLRQAVRMQDFQDSYTQGLIEGPEEYELDDLFERAALLIEKLTRLLGAIDIALLESEYFEELEAQGVERA